MEILGFQKQEYFGISAILEAPDVYYNELVAEAKREKIAPPIVINDLAATGDVEAVMTQIDLLIQNRIIDERINSTPLCSTACNNPTMHRYNLGKVCPCCGYRVTENRLESEVVLRAPEEIGAFITPRFWMLFNTTFGNKKMSKFNPDAVTADRGPDLMMWMIDPYYSTDEWTSRSLNFIKAVEDIGYERSARFFMENYQTIFAHITSSDVWHRIHKTTGKRHFLPSEHNRVEWVKLVQTQGRHFFTKHLLVVPSKLITAEETKRGLSVDPVFVGAVDAVKNLASLYTRVRWPDPRYVISRAAKVNRLISYFHMDLRTEQMGPKPGYYRAKASATFTPHSGRATITPISEPHDAWKLKAPWRWSVNLLSVDIENKLLRRGYTPRQCERKIAMGCMQYSDELNDIFKELIRESPGEYGIMTSVLRNPTLVQLSIQTLWIDEIITDVNVCSVRISDRVIKMKNAKRLISLFLIVLLLLIIRNGLWRYSESVGS